MNVYEQLVKNLEQVNGEKEGVLKKAGNELKKIRKKKGIMLIEIPEITGLHLQTVLKIERGGFKGTPDSLATFKKYYDILIKAEPKE